MIILDTSAIIRYLTVDDKTKAEKVKIFLETEKEIVIVDVVLPEIEYALSKFYKATRVDLIKTFNFLASLRNILLTREAKTAIQIFEKTKLDMADCIIAAYSFKGSLASFDSELLDIEGVSPFWKNRFSK